MMARAQRKNIFGFGKKKEAAPERSRGSAMTFAQAAKLAKAAGYKGAQTFGDWLEAKKLDTRSQEVINRLGQAYRDGMDAREKDDSIKEKVREAKSRQKEKREEKKEEGLPVGRMKTDAELKAAFARGLTLYEALRENPSLAEYAGRWEVSGQDRKGKWVIENKTTGGVYRLKSADAAQKTADRLNQIADLVKHKAGINPAAFDRCVKAVQKSGGAANAYAVCTAQGKRNPGKYIGYEPSGRRAFTGGATTDAAAMAKAQAHADKYGTRVTVMQVTKGGYSGDYERKVGYTDPDPSKRPAYLNPDAWAGEVRRGKEAGIKLFRRRKRVSSAELDQMAEEWSKHTAYWGPSVQVARDKYREGLEIARQTFEDAERRFEEGRRKNPAEESARVFKEFHGYAPTEVISVKKKVHHHEWLAVAGEFAGIQVNPKIGGDPRRIGIGGEAYLSFNEDKNQLFLTGGDQFLSTAELKKFVGPDYDHEILTLGKLTKVGYATNKTHLHPEDGGEAVYSHIFRTTNKAGRHVTVKIAKYPDLIYRVRDQQFEISGGSYKIKAEGIDQ